MGRSASFEESLQDLGSKWEGHSPELKASLDSMVTASCETTEDGKRRALDRANHAMVTGAKRRIEEYALSLSGPSMLLFGVGILLPLMVGSFMPMLSWSLWSPEGMVQDEGADRLGTVIQTAFVMNLLFPSIAVLVAIGAIARHPMEHAGRTRERRKASRSSLGLSIAVTAFLCSLVIMQLDGTERAVALLLSGTVPVSIWLVATNWPGPDRTTASSSSRLEEALFRLGARMQEGENFESAMSRVGADMEGPGGEILRRLWLGSNLSGNDFESLADEGAAAIGSRNALEGLKVVRRAASKDERSAGMLAMDLANYLRDLDELEAGLKTRLRPTISMMRVTAYALGPIVLGITFTIYLALAAMVGDSGGAMAADAFFMVLGVFLAEINAVVVFFVWGIGGGGDKGSLGCSMGLCLLASVLIYTATVTLAS